MGNKAYVVWLEVWFLCKPTSVLMDNLGGNGERDRRKKRERGEPAPQYPLQKFCLQFPLFHQQMHEPSIPYLLWVLFQRTEPFVQVMEVGVNNLNPVNYSTIFLEFVYFLHFLTSRSPALGTVPITNYAQSIYIDESYIEWSVPKGIWVNLGK